MPAKPLVSEEQWEILLNFMSEQPRMARGTVGNDSPLAKKKTADLWADLASQLNLVGTGTQKTPQKWCDYWCQVKYAARKKASERMQQASQMDGAPMPRKLILTDREKRILQLAGKVIVHSEESVRIPFNEPEPAIAETSPSPNANAPQESPEWVPEPVEESMDDHSEAAAPPPPLLRSSTSRRSRTGTRTRRAYRRIIAPAPEWVLSLEERRLATEARLADSTQQLANSAHKMADSAQQMAAIGAGVLAALRELTQLVAAGLGLPPVK